MRRQYHIILTASWEKIYSVYSQYGVRSKLEVLYKHTICTGVSQWCKSLMMTVKVEFSISTVELEVKYLYNHLNAAGICLCTSFNFKIRNNHRPQKWDGNTTKYWRLAHRQNYKKIAILRCVLLVIFQHFPPFRLLGFGAILRHSIILCFRVTRGNVTFIVLLCALMWHVGHTTYNSIFSG